MAPLESDLFGLSMRDGLSLGQDLGLGFYGVRLWVAGATLLAWRSKMLINQSRKSRQAAMGIEYDLGLNTENHG